MYGSNNPPNKQTKKKKFTITKMIIGMNNKMLEA